MNKINEYNQIVFYDLEMMGEKENDIIAIGAAKCGRDLKIIDRFHSYIKPIGERYISEFLSRLTGIKQENIDNAESFQKAMIKFFSWCNDKKCLFVSWGKQDYTQIFIDSKKNHISDEELNDWFVIVKNNYVDFQRIFYNEIAPKNASLEKSLKLYKKEFVGSMHNPEYDALNLYILYLLYKKSFYKSKALEILKVSNNQNEKLKDYFKNMADIIYNINYSYGNDNTKINYIIKNYYNIIIESKTIAVEEFIDDLIKTNKKNIKAIYTEKTKDYIDEIKKIKKKYMPFTKLYRAESKNNSVIYNKYISYGIGRIDKLIILLNHLYSVQDNDIADICCHNIYNIKSNIECKISGFCGEKDNTKRIDSGMVK